MQCVIYEFSNTLFQALSMKPCRAADQDVLHCFFRMGLNKKTDVAETDSRKLHLICEGQVQGGIVGRLRQLCRLVVGKVQVAQCI